METEDFKGRVTRIMFGAGSDDGFMIVQVEDDAGKKRTLKGTLHDCVPGTLIEGKVRTVHHPRFGDQLQAVGAMRTCAPVDKNGIAIFLSGAPGISEAKARKIAEQIPESEGLWDAVRNASPRIAAIVGEDNAHKLAKWFSENEALKDARIKLADWGLNRRQVTNAVNRWKLDTLSVVEANPWILAEDVEGVGWKTADMIAQKVGCKLQCVERARAAVLHVLREESMNGHAYCDEKELTAQCRNVMGLQPRLVEDAIRALAVDHKVVICVGETATDVYRASLYAAEVGIASAIAALMDRDNESTEEV